MAVHRFAVLVSLCCIGLCAAADDKPKKCPGEGVVSFYLENDLFYRSDRNYTSGIKLSFVSPDMDTFDQYPDCVPDLVQGVEKNVRKVQDLFAWFLNPPGKDGKTVVPFKRNIVTTLGQEIYTPGDPKRRDLIVNDRPYAGWLYLGLAYNERHNDPEKLNSLEVRLGMVGPVALGRPAQNLIHDLRGFDRFQGWDNQLRNEPGVQVILERRYRLEDRSDNKDATFHFGGSLGNVATYLNAGFEFRLGTGLPDDFGSSPARPSGNNTAPLSYSSRRKGGAHLFAALDARAVARDIFLDGNTFVHSHSVDKRPFVADVALGAAAFFEGFKLSFARVLRTQEFAGQPSRHSYGSITISYEFGRK